MGRRSIETEKQTLTERFEAGRRVIEAARREAQCLEKQVEEQERKSQAAGRKLQAFLETVAGLLQGKSDSVIPPREREILQKLDDLCNKVRSLLKCTGRKK